jgi:CubicO group peptidase (beta-lactamase class C family)
MAEHRRHSITRRTFLLSAAAAAGPATVFAQQQPARGRLRERLQERRAAEARTGEGARADMAAIRGVLPRTAAIIEDASARGGFGQFYLAHQGKTIADVAWGTGPDGKAVTPQSIVSWASAVKPCTCVVAMKLWESGKLQVDDPVVRFIPEFAVHDKKDVLIRHLLTHTAHLGGYAGPQQLEGGFDGIVKRIVSAPRAPYAPWGAGAKLPPPGQRPGYNPAGIWVLAEICRRIDGRPFERQIREELFEPCRMMDSWCGMPLAKLREYKAAGRMASNYLADEKTASICQPAGGGLGPTRELGRFYEMMLNRGSAIGRRILTPQTVEAMTTPKTGIGYMGIWGLGFNVAVAEGIAPENAGPQLERRLEQFGPHGSQRCFGHNGASGMVAFADPAFNLATAFVGRVPLQAAIYEDLKLATTN